MANAFWGISAVCILAVASGWNALDLRDEVNPPHPVAGLDVSETSASASLLGQFRTSTSSWLWLRTDLYLHNGVELRPLSESEKQAGRKGVGSAEADLGRVMGDESVVTSIPSPERDFRGWLGNLDRATSTYRDMNNHLHNEPEQAIPLFRLMTWIDPNFIEGWTAGSTVIARKRSDEGTKKALQFLNEGLKANPESVSILNEIAIANITRRKDLETAVTYLELARRSGTEHLKKLPESEREDFVQTYRWLALCYRDLNQMDEMREILNEGHELFSHDPIITMLMNQPPAITTEYGRKVWAEQQTTKARQAAEQKADEETTERDEHDGHDDH
jgi:hypothetical protein